MGIKYSFIDNKTYGTDDINDITRNLTGAGVAPFLTKNSYTAADFNGLTSAVVAGGVQLGGCKCSISGGVVTVAQGVIFFDNGATLTVDGEGYSVDTISGTEGYILAHFNTALQTADIIFADEVPATGSAVLLAGVSADGVLTDKRSYAASKVASFGKNAALTVESTATLEAVTLSGGASGYIIARFDGVNIAQFNYAIFRIPAGSSGNTAAAGVFDLVNNEWSPYVFTWSGGVPEGTAVTRNGRGADIHNGYGAQWYVEIIDGNLCIFSTDAQYAQAHAIATFV